MSFFFACRYKTPSDDLDAKFEIWELEISGNTEGKLTMMIKRIQIGEDKYSISGKISGMIKDYRWGISDADYKLKGKINNKLIEASFSGSSNMAEGPSTVSGKMSGTISMSEGSGIWEVFIHARGKSDGTYIMKKLEPSQ
jgi:hypothetical protein